MNEIKHSVLVIDDENSNIAELTHILSPEYVVYAATSGHGGIAKAEKFLPDVIILDIAMPNMDGYAVISSLKKSEKTKDIPILFTMEIVQPGDEEKGLILGASDYIPKPFSPATVQCRVRNQMAVIEQLRSSEYNMMKYKLASEALHIGLWDMDVVSADPVNPGNRFTWSPEFRRMLGFTSESEFPNVLHSWSNRLHPDDKERVLEAFAAHISDTTGETLYDVEYQLKLKNGEYRHFHALGSTQRDSAGVPIRVAGALLEITTIHRLTKQRADAEAASQTKSAFLAMMSHEIRTPMNVIWGVTEILMTEESLSDETMEGLGRIHNACGLLLGIINDILDFSKIEAGKMDITPAQYQVASLINDSVRMNMMRIGDKSIDFELHIDENIPARLIGDELRIKQILSNILSNAFKYTDAGTVKLAVDSELNEHGVTLIFSVQDTGHGMTQEQVGKLFDEYSRFCKDSSHAIEGTGLGLSITYRLIRLMDGEIRVESVPNKGSLFTVRLPQDVLDNDVLGKELADNLQQFRFNYMTHSKRSPIARDLMSYGSVLIVDDMEANIYVAVRLMRSYGLKIDTAMSGAEAIDKIKNGKVYDVVFMDHMMPEMDGIETAKHLRNLGYTEPIVALTANAVAGQAEIFLQNGFDAFVSKPIDIRQLNSVLNKLIRDKQPPEVIEAVRRRRESAAVESDNDDQSKMNPLLLQSVIQDAGRSLNTLENILQNGELKTEAGVRLYTITVHGIKGSLGNIDEKRLAESAYKLELAGRANNIELLMDVTPKFLVDLRELINRLEALQKADSGEESMEGLRDRLFAIEKMCEDCNEQGALQLLTAVQNSSAETQILLDTIKSHVLHGEFEEAAGTATAYANVLTVVLDE